MATAGRHVQEFEDLEQRHLADVRKHRLRVLEDQQLDPITREVLGLTGSAEELKKYREIAKKVGECAGEPIIRIESVKTGRVTRALGGFIAGELFVESSSFSRDDQGRGSGHAKLTVPVRAVTVVVDHGPGVSPGYQVYTGNQTRETGVSAAHIINHEWENQTCDPSNDFYEKLGPDNLLIGKRAIYHSPYFLMGLNDVLLAVEKVDRQHQESQAAVS